MFRGLFDEWWNREGEALYTPRMRQDCEDIWREAQRDIISAVADAVRDCDCPGAMNEISWQCRVAISTWLCIVAEEES
jgi:hypothetical protein